MIRNAIFGMSLLALSGSAFAATGHQQVSKPRVVAQAGDTAAPPAGDKADKKAKKSKKDKGTKTEGKTEGAKEMQAPAPTPAK